jgi:hypothetical protein
MTYEREETRWAAGRIQAVDARGAVGVQGRESSFQSGGRRDFNNWTPLFQSGVIAVRDYPDSCYQFLRRHGLDHSPAWCKVMTILGMAPST